MRFPIACRQHCAAAPRALPLLATHALLCALLVLVCNPATAARACLTLDRLDPLSPDGRVPMSVCMEAGVSRSLSLDGSPARRLPVASMQIDPGLVLIGTSNVEFTGRQWRVSGTQGRADLQAMGIHPTMLASVATLPAACFHEHAGFQGRQLCVEPGHRVDQLDGLRRQISSLRVPPDVSVRTFTGPHGTGTAARFVADADIGELSQLGMQDAIESVQVAHTRIPCRRDCFLPAGEAYDLPAIFGTGWRADARMRVLLTFDIDGARYFSINVGPVRIRFTPGQVAWSADGRRAATRRAGTHLYDARTRYVALALEIRPRRALAWQLAEFDGARQYVGVVAAPRIFPAGGGSADILSIRNERPGAPGGAAPKLVEAIFAGARGGHRTPRGANCDRLPTVLTVLSHALGLCQPPPYDARALQASTRGVGMSPTRTLGNGHNPMAVHAAARLCRRAPESMLNPRMRRGGASASDCIYRTATIISLYQALFGGLWDIGHFTTIIGNILRDGTTGYAVADAARERELIAAVLRRDEDARQQRDRALHAFHAANALYGVSLAGAIDLEIPALEAAMAPPRPAASCSAAGSAGDAWWDRTAPPSSPPAQRAQPWQRPRLAPPSPTALAAAMHGALGIYELDLTTYTPRTVTPRVMHGGRAEAVQEPFTVEIVAADDGPALRRLGALMGEWELQYSDVRDSDEEESPSCGAVDAYFLAATGQSLAMTIQETARTGPQPGTVLLVVSLKGRPMAVLEGVIPLDGSDAASVDAVLSAPANVLRPSANGAVRGAGSFALHRFLEMAHARGVRTVRTDAITHPSALVKARAGFRFVEEL